MDDSTEFTQRNVVDHGRTYHGYEKWRCLMPNDNAEQERLDVQHVTLKLLLNQRLSFVPERNPYYVLDVATGTAGWAIEFARQHPESEVVGTDLSAIQPRDHPENCCFIREDVEQRRWVHPVPFDLIHVRLFFTSFINMDLIIQNIWDNLEPGGWVEFQDHTPEVMSFDGSTDGSALEQFSDCIMRGLVATGRDPSGIRKLSARLKSVGYYGTRDKYLQRYLCATGWERIEEKMFPYPVGSWPTDPRMKEVGEHAARNMEMGLDGTMRILTAGGLSEAEAQDLSDRVRMEMRGDKVKCLLPFHVIFARKPLDAEGRSKYRSGFRAENYEQV